VKYAKSVLTEVWRISQVVKTTVSCVVQLTSMFIGIITVVFKTDLGELLFVPYLRKPPLTSTLQNYPLGLVS